MRRMLTLIRREFWEHSALWAAPLVVAALVLLGAVFGRASFPTAAAALSPDMARAVFALGVLGLGLAQYVTMSVVLWFYATDCLYSERKDRSILFWKSLPVSDAHTVLSKALVAIVIVPLGVYLITVVTSILAFGIWSLRGWGESAPPVFWDTAEWLRVETASFLSLAVASLWYAPLMSYLLLVSAWARRNVQLWVLLPPMAAVLVERLVLHTHYLSTGLLYRLGGGWQSSLVLSIESLFTGPSLGTAAGLGAPLPHPFAGRSPMLAFGNIDLWVGLAVAAAFLFGAIRIRRYRDDT